MPEAVVAAVSWLGAELGGAVGAALIMNAEAVAIGALTVGSLATSSAAQRRAKAKARAAYRASLKDRELTIRSGVAPRRYVYGRDRISGPLVYAETTGPKKEYLHLVIALAAHECEAIEEVWFGSEKLPEPDAAGNILSGSFYKSTQQNAASFNAAVSGGTVTLPRAASSIVGISYYPGGDNGHEAVTGWAHTPGSNTITGVTSPAGEVNVEYTWTDGQALVRIKRHLGQPGQVADADLVAESDGKWTAAHKGTGICYLYARLQWDSDVFGSTGLPEIKCVVKGRKTADARTSTVVWNDNTALAVADWLQRPEGLRASAGQVPSAEVIDAANVCDELVPLNLAGDTQRRYSFNGSFTSDQSPRDVLEDLLQAMAGSAVWLQGRWLVRPGAYRTPAARITPDMLAGTGVRIVPKASRASLYNAVRATYRDPAQDWAEVQAPLVTSALYEAEDGGVRRVHDIQLASAMDALRAQRLAKIELERARQAMQVQLTTNLAGYGYAPTDVVPLQMPRYGWAAGKDFEVLERTYSPEGTIAYSLRETAPGVWAWNYGEATTVDLAPDTALPNPYARPATLAGLAVFSGTAHLLRQVDGTLLTRAYLTWTPSADEFVRQGGRIDLQWRAVGTEQWQSEPAIPGDAASAYVAPVPDGTLVVFRVRQVNAVGSASDWAALMVTVLGKTEPPSDVTGLTSSVAAGVIRWAWETCPDIDYQATEVRATDADWGSDTSPPLWRGRVSEWLETVTATGTYTRHVRHLDTGGRPSAATATRAQVVGSGDLGGDAAVQPALVLTPESVTLAADTFGAVVSWADATTTATLVLPDGTDDTTGWTFSKVDTNVVSTLGGALGNVVTVSGFAPDAVAVDYANTVLQLHLDGSFKDTSRYNRTPSYVGMTGLSWSASGAFGQGLTCTDVTTPDGKIRFTGGADFRSRGGPWSLRAKFRLAALPSSGQTFYALGNGHKAIEFNRPSGAGPASIRGQWLPTAGAIVLGWDGIVTGQWYDIELAYASDGYMRLFVDGVLRSTSGTAVLAAVDATDTLTTTWIDIGTHWSVSGFSGVHFRGDIDEVRYIVEGGNRTATYLLSESPYPDGPYAAAAYVDVTATKGADSKIKRFSLVTVPSAPQQVVAASLSVPQVTVFADWDGSNVTLAGATSQLRCLIDGAESITQWQVTQAAVTAGVAVTVSAAGLVTVTAFPASADTGTVDFSLFRAGYPSQSVRLTISKSRRPQPAVNVGGPASIVVAGDTAGVVPSAGLPVPAAVEASQGGLVATSLYNWVVSASAGITLSSTTTASTTITAMSSGTDSGSITWTGTRTDWPTLTWRASVSKTRLLLPSGAVVASLPPISIFDNASAATAGLRVTADGRLQAYRQNATGAWVTIANWYNPTTSAIGSGYRVRLLGTPSGSTTGTWSAWQALSSDVTWLAGTEAGGSGGSTHGWTLHQLQIATSTGTDILGTYLVTATAIIESS